MLHAKDYRGQAWNQLRGRWGTMALSAFVFSLILGVCAALSLYYVGAVVELLILGPLTLGFTKLALNAFRGKDVRVEMLFGGFKNFGGAFVLYLINGIFIFLWSLLLIIPGIIKSFSYSMSYYILADHPEIAANEARKRSMELMKGNKWRLFCLRFSFIGWYLLSILTLGILMFWIMPYESTAEAAFYQSLLPIDEAEGEKEENITAQA